MTQDRRALERWTDEGGRPAREPDQTIPMSKPSDQSQAHRIGEMLIAFAVRYLGIDLDRAPRGTNRTRRDDALRYLDDRKP
jgi:hypothetical protein